MEYIKEILKDIRVKSNVKFRSKNVKKEWKWEGIKKM